MLSLNVLHFDTSKLYLHTNISKNHNYNKGHCQGENIYLEVIFKCFYVLALCDLFLAHVASGKVKIHICQFQCCARLRKTTQFKDRHTSIHLQDVSLDLWCEAGLLSLGARTKTKVNNASSKCTTWTLSDIVPPTYSHFIDIVATTKHHSFTLDFNLKNRKKKELK